jgi:hypothetical protein
MAATAICPRCGYENRLLSCQNCDGTHFRFGPLVDGSEGMICVDCNIGFSHAACQNNCGTLIPADAFGTTLSRMARNAKAGMEVHQGGQCFIATELYGSDSVEVAILRRIRDEYLLRSPLGALFVKIYYRISPWVVVKMRHSTWIHALLHAMVAMSVLMVRRTRRTRREVRRNV